MRFKKMHIGLMVIALCLILVSVPMAPQEAQATGPLQYYYSFESGGKTLNPSTSTTYLAKEYNWNPTNYIEFQKWNIENSGSYINSIGLQGMAQPPLRNTITSRPGITDNSYSLRLWDKSGTPDPNSVHATDTADRSQLQLIPDGHDGFHHLNEFYIGYSMMIPKGDEYFSPNPDGQWVLLFNLHTDRHAAFSINLASTSDSVTAGSVQLAGATWTLNCDRYDETLGADCANPKKDALFTQRMDRGVWYDFLIQAKMSDRTLNPGYVYVRMKRADEKWDLGNDNDYDHMVFQYEGYVGWAIYDSSGKMYYPFVNIYRSQNPKPTSPTSSHYRNNNHMIYVDEIRVGSDGGGWPSAVIVPGSFH